MHTKVDTVFDKENPTFKVLSSVLEYHPRYQDKCRNMHSICVKNHKNNPNKTQDSNDQGPDDDVSNKCFFIVRKTESGDEEYEDFSVNKCLQQLARNPPHKPQNEQKTETENQ